MPFQGHFISDPYTTCAFDTPPPPKKREKLAKFLRVVSLLMRYQSSQVIGL